MESSKKLTLWKVKGVCGNHKLNAEQSVKGMKRDMVKMPLVEVQLSIKNFVTQNKAKKE